MNNLVKTAILAMAMMISANFAWGQEVVGSSSYCCYHVHVKATLPDNAGVESIKATVKLYKTNGQCVGGDEMGDGYYSYDLATNTFTFNPFTFDYSLGATYAEVCVRGYWKSSAGTKWYTAGQTFSITSGNYSVNIGSDDWNGCPGEASAGNTSPY